MKERTEEIGVVELRKRFAEVMREVEMYGRTFYVTNNRRRVAKLSPVPQDEKNNEEEP